MNNTTVVYPKKCAEVIDAFLNEVKKVSKSMKFDLGQLNIVVTNGNKLDDYLEAIDDGLTDDTDFILIILPDDNKLRYDEIKKYLCYNEAPILSQCVKASTIQNEKGRLSKATKIVVQMATKFGAVPWSIKFDLPEST
jgi:aubergine